MGSPQTALPFSRAWDQTGGSFDQWPGDLSRNCHRPARKVRSRKDLAQEHDKKKDASRNAERTFDVVTRVEQLLDVDGNLPALKAAAAHLAKIARATRPKPELAKDDDAPKPLHPAPKGGLFGVPETVPALDRLATVEGWISAWPSHSFSTIARELMAIDAQLQVSAKLPQPEPFRASYPQRACV